MARGIVGDINGEPVVASPLYKEHFSLLTGKCLEQPALALEVWSVRLHGDEVQVQRRPNTVAAATGRHNVVTKHRGVLSYLLPSEFAKNGGLRRSQTAYVAPRCANSFDDGRCHSGAVGCFAVTVAMQTGSHLLGAVLFPVGFIMLYLMGFDLLTGVLMLTRWLGSTAAQA